MKTTPCRPRALTRRGVGGRGLQILSICAVVLMCALSHVQAQNTGPSGGGGGANVAAGAGITTTTNTTGGKTVVTVSANSSGGGNSNFFLAGQNTTISSVSGPTGTTNTVSVITNVIYITNGEAPGTINALISTNPNTAFVFNAGTFTLTNLIPTNFVSLVGQGAAPGGTQIIFAGGYTNFIIDCSTNVLGFSANGIHFNGGANGTNWAALIKPATAPYVNLFDPWYSGTNANTYSNRSGLRMNMTGGGVVQYCLFDGFGGYGVVGVGTNYLAAYAPGTPAFLTHCIIQSNWCNLGCWGWNYDWAQPGLSSGPGGPVAFYPDMQYCQVDNCQINAGGIGVYSSAGNVNMTGNQVNGNYINFVGGGGGNPGHGEITGNTFNHAGYAGVVQYSGQNDFNGNTFLADPYMIFDGPSQAALRNCHLGGNMTIIVTNVAQPSGMGQVSIVNNLYDNTWAAETVYTNLGPTSTSGGTTISGNLSETVPQDSDGTVASLMVLGVSSVVDSTFDTAYGINAGRNLSSALADSFFGYNAGKANTSGFYETALGEAALQDNATGTENTAVGTGALSAGNAFSGDTAIGYAAGQNNNSGLYNIYIGATQEGNATESYTAYLGATNTTANTYLFGNVAASGSNSQFVTSYRVVTNNTILTIADSVLFCWGTNQLVTNNLTWVGKVITILSCNIYGSVIITNTTLGTTFRVPGLGLTTNVVYLGASSSPSNALTSAYDGANW
jgi:hypothetical protein